MEPGKDGHMNFKWIGAIFIILSCGGFGICLASAHRKEEASLRQLVSALDYMECELQFRLTPLPDLCRLAGNECKGNVGKVLLKLASELEAQVAPDVASCVRSALSAGGEIPTRTREALELMGQSLGRFDLQGQLKGLEAVRASCRRELEALTNNRDVRLRSYQTLGFCAGAALAILFI